MYTIDFSDRAWWAILDRLTSYDQQQFILAAYRAGVITDWQLWDVLSSGHSRVPYGVARNIYVLLHFIPFQGYPLTPAIRED